MNKSLIILGCFMLPWLGDNNQSTSTEEMVANRASCGINSVYTFMKLHGAEVEWELAHDVLGNDGSGNSLLQLKEFANKRGKRSGFESEIVKLPTFGFSDEDLPVIAYGESTAFEVNDERALGHFVVILELNRVDRMVTYMDGTTGKIERNVHEDWFQRKLHTGYALKRTTLSPSRIESFVAIGLLIFLGCYFTSSLPTQSSK